MGPGYLRYLWHRTFSHHSGLRAHVPISVGAAPRPQNNNCAYPVVACRCKFIRLEALPPPPPPSYLTVPTQFTHPRTPHLQHPPSSSFQCSFLLHLTCRLSSSRPAKPTYTASKTLGYFLLATLLAHHATSFTQTNSLDRPASAPSSSTEPRRPTLPFSSQLHPLPVLLTTPNHHKTSTTEATSCLIVN